MAEMLFTDDNFEKEVLNESGVVFVDFFASWCGPCKMLMPVVDELAEEYEGKCKIGKVDVDENQSIAGKFGVQSIPTMIIFKNGKEVDRLVGFQSKEALKEKLDSFID